MVVKTTRFRASSELRVNMVGGGCLYQYGATEGDLAYLNEPVNAFSAANCPETVFRRVHTRMSSSHCAASWRGKEKRGCHCSDWREGRPPPTLHTHTPIRFAEQFPGGTGKGGEEWYWEVSSHSGTVLVCPMSMDYCIHS